MRRHQVKPFVPALGQPYGAILTDPSVKYYEFLGMTQIQKLSYPEQRFDLYFLAYDTPQSASPGAHWSDRQGVLQLGYKHGSENDDSFRIANGNSDPGKGFGHVCISVDHIQAACQRIEDAGYKFQKKLSDGRMREVAFALDPDNYWVYELGWSWRVIAVIEDLREYRLN